MSSSTWYSLHLWTFSRSRPSNKCVNSLKSSPNVYRSFPIFPPLLPPLSRQWSWNWNKCPAIISSEFPCTRAGLRSGGSIQWLCYSMMWPRMLGIQVWGSNTGGKTLQNLKTWLGSWVCIFNWYWTEIPNAGMIFGISTELLLQNLLWRCLCNYNQVHCVYLCSLAYLS